MINVSEDEYDSLDGEGATRKIRCVLFEPSIGGPHAAVVILPGTFGLIDPWGKDIRSFGNGLAEQGIVAFIAQYFDRTDTTAGEETTLRISDLERDHGDEWNSAIEHGIEFVASRSNVDAARLGLLGFSLGGNRALEVAMKTSPTIQISRLVELFAPTTRIPLLGDVTRLPKLQIHYDNKRNSDIFVPPSETEALVNRLERAGKSAGSGYFVYQYPGGGHGFKGDDLKNSRKETIAFFKAL
jgi:dienelactone hydrolase